MKKIVCLGGGNAMPKAVLVGLKKYPVKISAICAMLDSGGSAGRLRKDYDITSPGDIRRALLALADTSPVIENLFSYRFQSGELKGHNFANLFISALELSTNNYEITIKEVKKILNVSHEVLPVTLDKANLCAILENGEIIENESNIDVPKHDGRLKIEKIFLKPEPSAYSKAVSAIMKSDLIVIGPGDLYSTLSQILLTKGIPEAIKKSKAKKIYICNLMTKYGETNDFSVLNFTEEIEKYLNGKLDYVVYNNKKPDAKRLFDYKKEHPELINLVKINKKLNKKKFIGENLMADSGPIVHDSEKVAKIIMSFV